ncbi:MAG: hypothetical protein V4543_07665 [Bacteroidota bacterium]
MNDFTKRFVAIWEHLASPAFLWKVILRTDFGSRYLLNATNRTALLIPVLIIFIPFPFTEKRLWDGSYMLLVLSVFILIRTAMELLKYLPFYKGRKVVESTHRGNPLVVVKRLFPFLQSEENIKLFGEPFIALTLGGFFYVTGLDKFFGIAMLYIGLWHFWEEYAETQMTLGQIMDKMDQIFKAKKESEQMQKAQEKVEGGIENNKRGRDFETE